MKTNLGVRFCVFLLLFSLQALVPLFPQQGAGHVALLTEMRGDVFLKLSHASEFKKATWGTQLNEGDVLRTSDAGSASILLANKKLVEVGPSSSLTISEGLTKTARSSKQIPGPTSANTIDLTGLTLRNTSQGDVVALAGLRGGVSDASLVLLSPRNTKIRSIRPAFSWQANVDVQKYKIRLYSDKGLLWERKSDSTAFRYPADVDPLTPGGEYFWQIVGQGMVESYQSTSMGFRVVDEKELASIKEEERSLVASFANNPNATSLQYLMGKMYLQRGLYQESIKAFEAVAQRYPDAPAAHEVLGKLYNDVGLKDKAIEALQKALKLSQAE